NGCLRTPPSRTAGCATSRAPWLPPTARSCRCATPTRDTSARPCSGSGEKRNDNWSCGAGAWIALRPRVVLCVQPLQAFARDHRVDLRGGKTAVAQQHLQRAQVGAMVEEM